MCALAAKLHSELRDELSQAESGSDEEPDTNIAIKFGIDSFLTAKRLRGEIKDEDRKRKKIKISNNNISNEIEPPNYSETFETNEQSHLKISHATASEIIPIDLYNHLAWMITDADEETGPGGKVA